MKQMLDKEKQSLQRFIAAPFVMAMEALKLLDLEGKMSLVTIPSVQFCLPLNMAETPGESTPRHELHELHLVVQQHMTNC